MCFSLATHDSNQTPGQRAFHFPNKPSLTSGEQSVDFGWGCLKCATKKSHKKKNKQKKQKPKRKPGHNRRHRSST